MVNEINKIIYNLILSGSEVSIGGLGTLFTVRYAAYRASKKSLTLPHRVVKFTTEQRGVSLVDEIAGVAGVDNGKACEIFDRWLSQSLDGDTLTIEGVGVLRGDKFTADESLMAALNPQGRVPMRLKPKANVGLYVFASLCCLFALAVAGYVYMDSHDIAIFGSERVPAEVMAENNIAEQPVQEVGAAEIVVDSVKVELPVVNPQPVPQSAFDANAEVILSTEQGMSYVVLGVFSTTENAERAIRQAQKRANDLHYSVYHYGSKYMVALYDAQSRGECQEFIRSLGDTFRDLWIYSRK